MDQTGRKEENNMGRNTAAKTKYGTYLPKDERAEVLAYLGIPYAKTPVGNLRFKPPVELDEGSAVVKANRFGPAPLQPQLQVQGKNYLQWYEVHESSEDCLYLNIWTSDLEKKDKPVLFWIFGGSNYKGTTDRILFDGTEFVKRHPDVIVVTIGYRVGLLGTINLAPLDPEGEYKESNNLLLLDQRMALKWVYENIAAFGGDPDRITAYGHSAGSFDIVFHLALKESSRYLRGAICQSAFANAIYFPDAGVENSYEESLWFGEQLAAMTGAKTVADLQELSEEQIVETEEKLWKLSHPVSGMKKATVVADNIVVPENCFELLCKGSASHVSVMTGVSDGEIDQFFEKDEVSPAMVKKASAGPIFRYQGTEELIQNFIEMDEKYVGKHNAVVDLRNESVFGVPGGMIAQAQSHFKDAYNYRFVWNDPKTFPRTPHGMPQPFVFGNCVPDSAPEHLAEQVSDAWAAFVKTGNPNHPGIPMWEPYRAGHRVTMLIDEKWKAETDFRGDCRDLLQGMYKKSMKLLDEMEKQAAVCVAQEQQEKQEQKQQEKEQKTVAKTEWKGELANGKTCASLDL